MTRIGRNLMILILALFAATASAEPSKGAKPQKPVAAAAVSSAFEDGWLHVVFDKEVGPACMTVKQQKVVDGKPLYTCQHPVDNLFHAHWGAIVGEAWTVIDNLTVTKQGLLSYRGGDEKRNYFEILGDKKTNIGMWASGGEGGMLDFGGGRGESYPTRKPVRTSCDTEVTNYILAEGEPLWVKNEGILGEFVCWGEHKSAIWKHVANLRYEEGQIRYEAKDKDGKWHTVSSSSTTKTSVGKGYVSIEAVYYLKGQRRYAALDDTGMWNMVRGEQETKFNELWGFRIIDEKEFYVARLSRTKKGVNPLQ